MVARADSVGHAMLACRLFYECAFRGAFRYHCSGWLAMDRARRAMPVGSPATFLEDRRREQSLHVRRLTHVRSSVDASEPATMRLPHLRQNAKRQQLVRDRYFQIERENRILLEASCAIRSVPTTQL